MSLFSALSTAVTSVNALNSAVRVVSDNVANATNDAYNKRTARFENLQFGGVLISDITRAANDGLRRDLFKQTTAAAADEIRNGLFEEIESTFGTINGQTPLVDEVERLRSAFKALEASPESDAAQNEVLLTADSIKQELTRLSNGLDLIENQVLVDIESIVSKANEALEEVDRINAQIVSAQAANRPIANLQNLRDAEIAKVAELVEIRTFERDDGSTSIYTSNGTVLVDSEPETFTWNAANRTLTLTSSPSTDLIGDEKLPDGEIVALADFIRTDSAAISSSNIGVGALEKLRNQLDGLAFSLADDSTARTSGSVYVKNNQDLTTSGITTAGNTLTFDIGGTILGTVTINANDSIDDVVSAINAVDQIRARVDSNGTLQVLSNGGAFTIGGTAAGDFGLSTDQISADATDTLSYAYKKERSAGTVPLLTTTNLTDIAGVANNDTITFQNADMGAAVTLTIVNAAPVAANEVQTVQELLDAVNANSGMYARLGDGNVLEFTSQSGALSLTEGGATPLTGLGFTMNGTSANILGSAESTDSPELFVAETGNTPLDVSRLNFAIATALDNRSANVKVGNVTEIVAAMNGTTRSFNGSSLTLSNSDYTGFSNRIVTDLAQRGLQATENFEESLVLRRGLEQSLRDEIGVNIDEELAQLTVLQNSYAATARVIDTINQMFQALEIAGR